MFLQDILRFADHAWGKTEIAQPNVVLSKIHQLKH